MFPDIIQTVEEVLPIILDEGKQFDKPEETEVMAMSAEEEAPVSLEENFPSVSEILADGTVTCKPGKDTSILETEQDWKNQGLQH